jgi:hypothetical protein
VSANPPQGAIHCDRCREVIGVYEPMVAVIDGEAVTTSRAARVKLPRPSRRYHRSCFVEADGDYAPSPSPSPSNAPSRVSTRLAR